MVFSITKYSLLVMLGTALFALATTTTTAAAVETVCPSDYYILQRLDGSEEKAAGGVVSRRQLQLRRDLELEKEGVDPSSSSQITIIRQGGSYVEFTVQNTTSWDSSSSIKKPDHIFTSMQTDVYGSLHCYMNENMVGTGTSSSTETMKATCEDRPNAAGPIAVVKTFLRYYDNDDESGSSSSASGGIAIPNCCHDPYATTTDAQSNYKVIKYVLLLNCTVSCDNPEEYVPPSLVSDSPSSSPAAQPSDFPSSSPIIPPSSSPVAQPSDSPSSSPIAPPSSSPVAQPSDSPSSSPIVPPSDSPSSSPIVPPSSSPVAQPSHSPSSSPIAPPSTSPSGQASDSPSLPLVPRRSLQEEIIKDMMPESSSKCFPHNNNDDNNNAIVTSTTYTFESSQAESEWNTDFMDYEQDVFLAKMQNIDAQNSNRTWTIRLGRAGNIYSLQGPMGETVPPQNHDKAPWVDEVWQAVQPLGSNGDNDSNPDTGPYFIHEAGTYQKDGDYTATKPFYSPTIGSYCNSDEHECGFSSWGQQAHLPTPWKSPMLYFNRYVNCGNGVFEYTTLRHNNVGSDEAFGYLNVPWGGTRTSVLGDIVVTSKATQEQNVIYPLVGWSDGANTALKDTMGYTIFAEDLPKGANPLHDTPYPLPDGLDLTIGDDCYCEGNCRHPHNRYVCPLHTPQPENIKWVPNRGDPGIIVRMEGRDTGKSVVAGIRHWAGNSKIYFYQSDVLTLAQIKEALTVGTKVDVFYYLPPESGKPEEDNLALAHVHGNSWNGNYPRIRYGAAGRDYNVYTVNDIPRISEGSTYYYRQYFMMDAYTEMKTKGPQWGPEAMKATKTVGSIEGRTVQLYKSAATTAAAATTFGHTIHGDTCRTGGAAPTCEGMTTPQANSKALFQIRCGDSYVVTENMYHFSPSGPSYRSYVCDGMEDQRPEWTLLGYFPEGSCSTIGSGYQYDSQYC